MARLDRTSHRRWDLIIKIIAALAFVVPLWISSVQWTRTATLDTKKPYLEKQLDVCIELVDAAATIATNPNLDAIATAIIIFDRLFWGRVAIFDNGPIYEAGTAFRKAAEKQPRPDLRKEAEAIAHSCKNLVRGAWDIR